ncbi:recombinase family protein [Streptomyces hygroscopicus]|uniref:recombinase family protein n=1 Tax=Streptomyces hygroscopicus TaxID=1912 RepID=UPI003633B38E
MLAAEPLVCTETKIGYARVSTGGQKLERQLDALTAAGCRKIFADKKSGKDALRPELKACHAFLDAGDTLVVPSLDRYGRSLQDLIDVVAELRERGIGFTSLHENLDTTTPGGRLVFHVFAALAEFIRELIVIGTKEAWPRPAPAAESVDAPASPPRRSSAPPPRRSSAPPATCCPTPAARSPRSPSSSGSPRGTLYNYMPDLRELRASAVPRQLEASAR